MASGQTANFGLNQWVAKDPVLREEFNQDNAKLDAVLEQLSAEYICIGSYTGDGTADTRTIPLPFTPQLVMVSGHYGNEHVQYGYFTIAFGTYCHSFLGESNGGDGNIRIVEKGFQILGTHHNLNGFEEHYIAIR